MDEDSKSIALSLMFGGNGKCYVKAVSQTGELLSKLLAYIAPHLHEILVLHIVDDVGQTEVWVTAVRFLVDSSLQFHYPWEENADQPLSNLIPEINDLLKQTYGELSLIIGQ